MAKQRVTRRRPSDDGVDIIKHHLREGSPARDVLLEVAVVAGMKILAVGMAAMAHALMSSAKEREDEVARPPRPRS